MTEGPPPPAEDDERRKAVVEGVLRSYAKGGDLSRLEGGAIPSREVVWSVVEDLLRLLFPGFLEPDAVSPAELARRTGDRIRSVERRLAGEIEKGLRFGRAPEPGPAERRRRAADAAAKLLGQIPGIRDVLAADIEAAYEGDPAAQSLEEIVLAYPGLQAIAVYRLAHTLYLEDVPIVPRVMTEHVHARTGIDIHPGATIGKRFFIDHGTGVVIGETATIGDNVKVYQGVTLGARSFLRDNQGRVVKGSKRHPDIEDDVTIYSGATILGDVRIGARSIVGGNVWLTHAIPEDTKIIVRPPQQIHIDRDVSDYQI